jgi:hypothetical protein
MTDTTERQDAWTDRAAGKTTISVAEASDLLTRTSTNNATGLIGGPFSVTGYTLDGSLRILKDARTIERGRYRGVDTICALYPRLGAHMWYLNLQPRRENPWA